MPRKIARWTILVYIAGDNDLSAQALKDLRAMKRGLTSERVRVVVHLDTRRGRTRRYLLTRHGKLIDDLRHETENLNSGDVRTLIEFARWGAWIAPAERYMLVLWGHAQGWDDVDPYERSRTKRALFKPYARRHDSSFPLARDDTARDFLSNADLREGLKRVHDILGKPVDLLGLDVCLMAMIEVLYEIRDHTGLVVASEEIEPTTGWPHEKVIRAVCAHSRESTAALGKRIVREYVAAYPPDRRVTQSALDPAKCANAVAAASALAELIVEGWATSTLRSEFMAASASCWRSRDTPDYADIGDLSAIIAGSRSPRNVREAARRVTRAVREVVLHSAYRSRDPRKPRGLSVYLPLADFQPEYRKLEFASETAWATLAQLHAAEAEASK